jgi:hypothetical protein
MRDRRDDQEEREPIYAQALHTGEAPKPQTSKRKHWAGYVMATAFIGVVLATLVILGLKFADGPAAGHVLEAGMTPLPTATAKPAATMQLLNGTYFSLKYPSIYDTVSHKSDGLVFLDMYNLSSQKDYRRLMTISVHKFDYDLESDSDFKSRQLHNYKQEAVKVGAETAYTMTNPAGGETTMFWLHKGLILEVSATSSSSQDDLAAYIAQIRPTVVWRQ